MATHSSGDDPANAAPTEAASTRRLLAVFCSLLAGFALLLAAAWLAGDHLRQPLGRVPLATYAARRGIALPSTPVAPLDYHGTGRTGATPTAARRADAPGTASPTPTASPPPDSQFIAEVTTAYLLAWERWAEACLSLDTAPLISAFAPPELDRARDYVLRLRASGRALRLDVTHRLTILELDSDSALLLDDLNDSSLYLDPGTRQPLPATAQPTPVGAERVYCRLRRTEMGWRVVDLSWGR